LRPAWDGCRQSRAFEIIEALVQSLGELVTKDDLMEQVWSKAIVEDNTLQVPITAIREALGDDRGLLKTVNGRGYRLLGSWRIPQEKSANEPDARERRRSPRALLAPLYAQFTEGLETADLKKARRALGEL
jgi:non-specific serine/threonine protein kinase